MGLCLLLEEIAEGNVWDYFIINPELYSRHRLSR